MDRKMNFVMISPHFPANFETFAHRLYENGINTLGIADAPYEQLSQGLRTDFNVFGYKNEDMLSIKTKARMKEIFRKTGIKVARGRVFTSTEDARALTKELGFPVIIKPNSGVGASDTYKIKSAEELEDFFGYQNPTVDYIMEEFIDGDIVTFDGLTDHEGNIVFYSSLEYSEAVLDTVEKDNDMFYYVPRDISPELIKLGEQCVEAFNVKERFFHFEFFRIKKTKDLMALEVNCRPPGGLTIDMWDYANDFDVFNEYAHIVKDNRFEAHITHPYNVVYIARKANKHYAHSIEDIETKFGHHIIEVESVPGIFAKIMGEVGILARTETMNEMRDIICFAHAKI